MTLAAQALYEASAAYQARFRSEPFPAWGELPTSIREQWEKAARAGDQPVGVPDWDTRDQEVALAQAEEIQETLELARESAIDLLAHLETLNGLAGHPESLTTQGLVDTLRGVEQTIHQLANH